jgi:hypothetical protein
LPCPDLPAARHHFGSAKSKRRPGCALLAYVLSGAIRILLSNPLLAAIALLLIFHEPSKGEERRPYIEVERPRIVEPERFFLPVWGWVTCNDTGEFDLRRNPKWRERCEPVNRRLK